MEDAPCVQVEQQIPGLVGGFVHRRTHAEPAGDVAEHVNAPDASDSRLNGSGDR
jgi:hypothetical protein